MRLGVCSWAFGNVLRGTRPARELAEVARRAGFDTLEAAFFLRSQAAPDRADGPDRSDGPDGVGAGGAVTSLATLELHRCFLTDARPERRQRAFEVVRAMVASAERRGIPSVSFSPGPLPAGEAAADVFDRLAEELGPLAEDAQRRGVRVALENLPASCVAERAGMKAALDRLPGVGLCLDIGNALLSPPLGAWVDDFGGRLFKLHLSDGVVEGGAFAARLPLEGAVAWAEVRDALRGAGVPDEIYVEAPLPAGSEETTFLPDLARRAREALAL
jgi:sugar phosphate isomerase/epimerase